MEPRSTTSATPELTWGIDFLSAQHPDRGRRHALPAAGSPPSAVTSSAQARAQSDWAGWVPRLPCVGAAFGMDVVAWSQNLDEARAADVGAHAVSKEELFATSDVVTLHYKLSERSRRLIAAEELSLMKPSSIFINTSRAGLVDTQALSAALYEGRIRGAGLDVYDSEPLPADHALRSAPRTVLVALGLRHR